MKKYAISTVNAFDREGVEMLAFTLKEGGVFFTQRSYINNKCKSAGISLGQFLSKVSSCKFVSENLELTKKGEIATYVVDGETRERKPAKQDTWNGSVTIEAPANLVIFSEAAVALADSLKAEFAGLSGISVDDEEVAEESVMEETIIENEGVN